MNSYAKKQTNKFLIHKFHLILSRLMNYQLEEKQFHSGHKMKLSLSKRIHTCVIHSARFRANQRKTRPTRERMRIWICSLFRHWHHFAIYFFRFVDGVSSDAHTRKVKQSDFSILFPSILCLLFGLLRTWLIHCIALLLLWVHQTDKTHLKFMCWC